MASDLERTFDLVWRALDGPKLASEHRFSVGRRWSFDRAWVEAKIAFEIEGGTWIGGRHTRGSGFRNDCEKYNAAEVLGWHVFRLTGEMVSIRYLNALLRALMKGGEINFRFAGKGSRARRFKHLPKGENPCNSFRRSGGAPSSSSP